MPATLTPSELETPLQESEITKAATIAQITDAIRQGDSFQSACDKYGICKRTVELWRASEPAVNAAFTRARAFRREWLLKRAEDCETKWGTPDPNVAMFLLGKEFSDDYGEKFTHEHTHTVSLPASAQMLLDRLASMAETGQLEAPTCPIPAIEVQSAEIRVSAS